MEARRYLRCMGQPALFSPAGEPIRFRTKKHLALLVYLAVESRHAHRRDRLAEVLWPKVSTSEARHSLATALSILRPRLGSEILETSRDQVVLAPGRIALDLDRLVAGDVLGTEVTGKLEVAAFLEGFDIPDAVEFAMWKDRQQARLLPAIKDALVVLIDRCRRTGDSRQIEQLADRMLALDELSEEAIRAKMEARAFAGDRLTALRIFEEWRQKLAEDVSAVPSELVEGIAVRLRRRGWERTTRTDIPTVPTDQWRGRPFIGRSKEYQVLYEAWEAMRQGVPAHALVLGDSGIGKTTLVERLTTAAGLEGAVISRVQCYDLEREIPYATLGTLILGLLDRPGVSATPPEALAEIARTIPEVRRRFPSIPPSGESEGETARIRLAESFIQMLQALAEEHPVILVVDDLHLADDASVAVLHLVMRRAGANQVMVLLIARPGELPRSPRAGLFRTAPQSIDVRELEIVPLNETESRDLLSSLVPPGDPQPSVSLSRALLRAAAGFPMVLELLVQDWQANGDHSMALAINAMTADIRSLNVPPYLSSHALERITQTLSPATLSVLNLSALLGRRLNDVGMYVLVDSSVAQTMTGMAELVSRRVLRDSGQGLEFINELIRTAAYLRIPSPLRRVLHSHIADRFILQDARDEQSLGLEIAWHCTRAGRSEEATPYLLKGAQEAISMGALDAAEYALTTALPNLRASDREEAALLLAEVLQEQGRWQESAAILADCAIDPQSDSGQLFSINAEHGIGGATAASITTDLERLGTIIRRGTSTSIRIKAAKAAARLVTDLRDERVAGDLLNGVESIPTDKLSESEVIQVTLSRAQLLYHVHDRSASLKSVLEVAKQMQVKELVNSTMVNLHNGLGAIRCHEGRYQEGKTEYRCAYDMSTRLGNHTAQGNFAAHVALCSGRLGQYEEQIEWGRRAAKCFGPTFYGYNEVQAAFNIAFGLAMRGETRTALLTIEELDQRIPDASPPWLIQAWRLAKADIQRLCGRHDAAHQEARSGIGMPQPKLHAMSFAGAFARWIALCTLQNGDRLDAREQLDQMRRVLETFDAIDQVEILCARRLFSTSLNESDSYVGEIWQRLELLPAAVSEQLRRLGVLDS
jgi:DNA-binding SARP family transcriptional activator/tetratricopeptide (TPR) repeat protein